MKRLVLAALVAAAACGGNNNNGQDAAPPPPPGSDANPGSDAGNPPPPPPAQTLTAYVIDLVTNHTTATDLPRPYAEFSTLADPDSAMNNLAAYQSLF